jgi:hypothetical protein
MFSKEFLNMMCSNIIWEIENGVSTQLVFLLSEMNNILLSLLEVKMGI